MSHTIQDSYRLPSVEYASSPPLLDRLLDFRPSQRKEPNVVAMAVIHHHMKMYLNVQLVPVSEAALVAMFMFRCTTTIPLCLKKKIYGSHCANGPFTKFGKVPQTIFRSQPKVWESAKMRWRSKTPTGEISELCVVRAIGDNTFSWGVLSPVSLLKNAILRM